MSIFRGVNGTNRELIEIYRGISGVNRSIKEVYRGVNGVNRQVFGTNKMLLKRTMNYPMLNSNLIWETEGWYSVTSGRTPPVADQFGGSPYYVKIEGGIKDGAHIRLKLKDPIDLTQFSKLCVKWQITFKRERHYSKAHIYLGDTPRDQYLVTLIDTNTNGIVESEFDISKYNGLWYLRFFFYSDSSPVYGGIEANVYDIWLS